VPALSTAAPTALVVGSAIEYEDRLGLTGDAAAVQQSCAGLAELLARLGFNVLNNACPGLPDFVMRAFAAQPAPRGVGVELSILKSPHDTSSSRAVAPDGFPLSGDLTVFCDAGFEALSPINARCADCVVVVGGGLGSLAEAATCVMQGLPVICFDSHEGVAREIEPLFGRYLTRYRQLRATTCSDLLAMERALSTFAAGFRAEGAPSNLSVLMDEIARAAGAPGPMLRISIEADAVIYRLGAETLRVADPTVLIDRRRMAEAGDADRWLGALAELDRLYEVDGVSLRMSRTQCEAIWGPSIETALLLDVLRAHVADGRQPASVLNVGSGAGLVGLWLAAHTGADVVGLDLDPDAVLCANANAAGPGDGERLRFVVGDFHEHAPGRPVDLLVSNPPYLPHPDGVAAAASAVCGVELLLAVLRNGPGILAPGGVGYVALSSCSRADPRVAAALERPSGTERVSTRPTPFKVSEVFHDPAWLQFLLDSGGLTRRDGAGYAYWHDVEIWRLGSAEG
jgi:methylase of polypeptide subunit release factors/predicted Rossmann-fold nucleotide-binding protein